MHSMRSRSKTEGGFTLVELLVVIIIIGILVAIAIPVFLNQRAKASEAAVKSDLRSIAAAYEDWGIGRSGIAYPDILKEWHQPGEYENDHMGTLSPIISNGVRIHAFDMGIYYPELGYKPGDAFCIQGRHVNPKVKTMVWHSAQGGLSTTTCGSLPPAG